MPRGWVFLACHNLNVYYELLSVPPQNWGLQRYPVLGQGGLNRPMLGLVPIACGHFSFQYLKLCLACWHPLSATSRGLEAQKINNNKKEFKENQPCLALHTFSSAAPCQAEPLYRLQPNIRVSSTTRNSCRDTDFQPSSIFPCLRSLQGRSEAAALQLERAPPLCYSWAGLVLLPSSTVQSPTCFPPRVPLGNKGSLGFSAECFLQSSLLAPPTTQN